MDRNHHNTPLLLLVLTLFLQNSQQSWAWFFSSKESSNSNNHHPSENPMINPRDGVAEFSMELFNNPKGVKQLENAKNQLATADSCLQMAYRNIFAGCSEVLASEERRSRLAWHLTDCFQRRSGRPGFPSCDEKLSMMSCLKNLDEDSRKIYLEFYLETNSICHQLQTEAFKRQTERLVNELKRSAEHTEDKLDNIEKQAEHLLHSSNQIHNTLDSIDVQTKQVTKMTTNVRDHVGVVLKHSEAVYEHSKGIAASQLELHEGQTKMKEKMEEGMMMLHDSYNNLGLEINSLREEAVEIEREIGRVGKAMSSKMETLQSKADDIGNTAEISLDKQKKLLDSQSLALEGLDFLTKVQSQALEVSRGTLQQFAEFGQKQQEELLRRQEQLQRAHDHLIENSKTMLAAQEEFESKQTSMFAAIDKLFTLHNAILLESRLIKSFLFYSISIFVVYMFTSTKQTYTVRPNLYIGLCLTFWVEVAILRYAPNDIEHQTWIISVLRWLAVVLATIQLLYAILTYRDYEVLNHQMLQTLIEKVNGIEGKKETSWDTDTDSEVNWSSWIETELTDDLDYLMDPDYILPEEVGENSVATTSTTRIYNLRNRHHHS